MKLKEKYKSLSNPITVQRLVVDAVYSTMQLEEQPVSKERLNELYRAMKDEAAPVKQAA